MSIIIDDPTIAILEKMAAFLGTCVSVGVGYLFKKGYIDIWLSKIFTPTEVIHAVKKQNGNALVKLNMPDDILCVLDSFETNDSGQIVLKGHGRVNTILRLDRPLTAAEKDEVIKAVRKIFVTCKE